MQWRNKMTQVHLNSIYQTPGIRIKMQSPFVAVQIHNALMRHTLGDWGDLDEEDHEANNKSLHTKNRIVSAYHFDQEEYTETGKKKFKRIKFWIITEGWPVRYDQKNKELLTACGPHREITTILLPSEY